MNTLLQTIWLHLSTGADKIYGYIIRVEQQLMKGMWHDIMAIGVDYLRHKHNHTVELEWEDNKGNRRKVWN